MSNKKVQLLRQMFDEDASEEVMRHRRVKRLMEMFDEVEEPEDKKGRKGSAPGHDVIKRNRIAGHYRLFKDYFAEPPIYSDKQFRTRFRMSRRLFCKIVKQLELNDDYFTQKYDAARQPGPSPLQKVTAAIRQLAYGVAADAVDEYVRIGASTALESLKHFCFAISRIYGDEYLRSPNEEDIKRLLAKAEERGLPGMLGSLDCMHWEWKNCPSAWKGAYQGRSKTATIILEAVADADTWIWHAFFGLPGSLNDLNVLHRSPLFAKQAAGVAPDVKFTVNGKEYTKGYYLVDGIYPPWATLMDAIRFPVDAGESLFTRTHEAHRKDVERAFGILQARFAVIRYPARLWQLHDLYSVMRACIILHNMIIEDQRDHPDEDIEEPQCLGNIPSLTIHRERNALDEFMQHYDDRLAAIKDTETHHQLKRDLVEHLWLHQRKQPVQQREPANNGSE